MRTNLLHSVTSMRSITSFGNFSVFLSPFCFGCTDSSDTYVAVSCTPNKILLPYGQGKPELDTHDENCTAGR